MKIENSARIAVLIPCYNEETTIGKVVDDFKRELPNAEIYVFDNNSTDNSAQVSRKHGATIIKEPRQGKGYVIGSMFEQIDADIYVLVDGDDTYSATHVHQLIEPVRAGNVDMTIGARWSESSRDSIPFPHRMGNNLIRWAINWVFHAQLTDIFSGYRVFSHRIVQQIPVVSMGFELETEMTIQLLYYQLKVVEINVPYKTRPTGSQSKLRTLSDGCRVLWKLFSLFYSVKPLMFFGSLGLVLMGLGILAGTPPILDYIVEQRVKHVPLAILATGLILLSVSFIFLGIVLQAINYRLKELHNVLTR